jgi:hypothetical protein
MTRERLSNRRAAETLAFEHGGRRWRASVGRFADGRLGEIFLDAEREGALLASLALQHGCAATTLRHALDGRDIGPLAAALYLVEATAK